MKKLFIIIITIVFTNTVFGQKTINALFIGNSYTGYNSLPQLVRDVAQSAGDTLIFGQRIVGGATFQTHASNTSTFQKIANGTWDYVILQGQSQEPSFPIGQVQANTFPYAAIINDSIELHQPCGETMFYMTWGRKNGDANNCPNWPPVCTYEGMDSLLRLRYEMMANMNAAELAPVGVVWRYLRTNHPNINLYSNDGSHPSAAGSYAAACTFYAAMFRKDPTAITDDFSLNAADAMTIRNATKAVVFDDLITWNIGAYDPMPDFSFSTLDSAEFNFTNNSINADSYYWDFGDGNSSVSDNPTHTFSNNATYTVTLNAIKCGDTISISKEITAYVVATNPRFNQNIFKISPNPTTDFIQIETTLQDFKTYIYNQNGQLIGESQNENKIEVSHLPKGIYFLKIKFNGKIWEKQFLKY